MEIQHNNTLRRIIKVRPKNGSLKDAETKSIAKFTKLYSIVIEILTGFNFDSSNRSVLMCIIHVICFLLRLGAAINYICESFAPNFPLYVAAWVIINFLQSLVVFVSHMLCKSKLSCRELLEFLYGVDEELGRSVGIGAERLLALYTSVATITRLCIYIFVSLFFYVHIPSYTARFFVGAVHNVPRYCSDLFLVIVFVLYYSVYCRLKALRLCLNGEYDVYQGNLVYKSLIDNFEDIRKRLDFPLLMILLSGTCIAMVNILHTLQLSKENEFHLGTTAPRYIEVILLFSLIFAPTFVAELMSSEAQKIKNILLNKLQTNHSTTEAGRREVHQFSRYVSARPFRLRACRVLPLDCTLPVTVLSVCVTYTIVCVQFLHLY